MLLGGLLFAAGANATSFGAYKATVEPADVFPGADKFGPFEGSPTAAAAYRSGKVVGYVFATSDIGYSGKPIKILAGLDSGGVIVGAKIIEHHEPILLVGIPQERLFEFVSRYVGRNIVEFSQAKSNQEVDAISGATVTAVVVTDGLMRGALRLARSRGIAGFAAPAAGAQGASLGVSILADVPYAPADWPALVRDGLIRRLHLSNAEVDTAFKKIGVGSPEPYGKAGKPEDLFIDLNVGLFSIETIGRSLVSEQEYTTVRTWLGPGQAAVIIAASGEYSFRGSGFVRGGIFDRLQLIQDDATILFKDKDYRRLDVFAAPGSPNFKEIGLFRLPEAAKFEPTKPFRLDLLVQRPIGPIKKAFTSFSLGYELPARYVTTAAAPHAAAGGLTQTAQGEAAGEGTPAVPALDDVPGDDLWVKIWHRRAFDIAILSMSLATLMFIFVFQDWLVKKPVLFTWLRTSFLIFSVVWL
ncbi:MAG: FMN-binding protein, partial [Hyphomicrobium sp.]